MFRKQILTFQKSARLFLKQKTIKTPIFSLKKCYQTKSDFNRVKKVERVENFRERRQLLRPDDIIRREDSFDNFDSSEEIRHPYEYLQNYDYSKKDCDWRRFKEEFTETTKHVGSHNVNAIILRHFVSNKLYEPCKEFIRHLNKNEGQLNVGALGQILRFYYYIARENLLTDDDVSNLFSIHNHLIEKYKVLDQGTSSHLICALSFTSRWADCVELLATTKKYGTPITSAYSAVAAAAFNNQKVDVGWQILQEIAEIKKMALDEVFVSWFNFCVRNYKKKEKILTEIEKLLIFSAESNFKISQKSAEALLDIFKNKLGWSGNFLSIPKGKCSHCTRSLDPAEVTNEEYELLRDEFYKKVIIGRNVFIKSSPAEVESFQKFLSTTKPFNLVIDSLNIGHSTNQKATNKMADCLITVVKKMIYENPKILILGKKHMSNWPRHQLEFLKKNTFIFFTEDSSYDDLFILYAALSSPDTYFISRDLMRGHRFMLKDESLKLLFKKWQQSHQYMVDTFTRTGNVFIKAPIEWCVTPHKNVSWHIPINESGSLMPAETYDPPEKWLCLSPPSKETEEKVKVNEKKETKEKKEKRTYKKRKTTDT